MMKAFSVFFITALLCLGCFKTADAQVAKRLYLFEDFADGTVLLKNKSKVNVRLNYDAANKEMIYLENNEHMVLTGIQQIDTVFADNRKFIVAGRLFLEVVGLTECELFINWKLKTAYKGKKGAYGQVSQSGNVDHINTNHWVITSEENQSPDIYDVDNDNEYWLRKKDKLVKFKNEKSFLKLFEEDQRPTIKAYIKEQKINMKSVPDVLKLADFCSRF